MEGSHAHALGRRERHRRLIATYACEQHLEVTLSDMRARLHAQCQARPHRDAARYRQRRSRQRDPVADLHLTHVISKYAERAHPRTVAATNIPQRDEHAVEPLAPARSSASGAPNARELPACALILAGVSDHGIDVNAAATSSEQQARMLAHARRSARPALCCFEHAFSRPPQSAAAHPLTDERRPHVDAP